MTVRIRASGMFGTAGLLWLVCLCHADAAGADDTRPLPVELRPYRVSVSVAFANDPLLNGTFRHSLRRELAQGVERTFGQCWQFADGAGPAVDENDWLLPAGAAGLERLDAGDLSSRFQIARPDREGSRTDKVYLLALECRGGEYVLSGCEWDTRLLRKGGVRTRTSHERGRLASQGAALLRELFQPVVSIDSVEGETARVRLHGGELLPPSPGEPLLRAGTLLMPIFRYLDREGELQRVQEVPWTFLEVEQVDRGDIACTLKSGLRSPLGQSRRRVEALAVGVAPVVEQTRVRLAPAAHPDQPLIGYEVTIEESRVQSPESRASERPLQAADSGSGPSTLDSRLLLTDRRGVVTIPADRLRPLVWISVHSGTLRLARVPYVPGLEAETSLLLPDDSVRLNVEGELALLESDLIDTVARRAILLADAVRHSRRGDLAGATSQLDEIGKLPDAEAFRTRLNTIRYPALDAARARKDRLAELRIEKLCRTAGELIAHYLDRTKVDDLEHEIKELERLAR